MKRIIYYSVGLVLSIILVYFAYDLAKNKIKFKNSSDSIIVRDSIKIDTQFVSTSNILFITQDKVQLKEDANESASTIDLLSKNSIFYIVQKGKLDKLIIKGKSIEDSWYEVTDRNDKSGWVFGYYTSKAIK